jgi:hypothetical protein
MADIFISYAHQDRETAGMIAEVLIARGWTVWWDRRIPPGLSFADVIEQEIASCKCLVVLWSASSVTSTWVKNEVAEATRRGIVIPVAIQDVRIPMAFRHMHTAELILWQPGEASAEWDGVLRRVEQLAPLSLASASPGVQVEGAVSVLDAAARPALSTIGTSTPAPWLQMLARLWPLRLAAAAALALIVVGSIGFVATTGFNSFFGRTGVYARFGVEPWSAYFVWGWLAVFPSLVIITLTALMVLTAGFLLRLLGMTRMAGWLGRRWKRSRDALTRHGLSTPTLFARTFAGLAIGTLCTVFWLGRQVITGWTSFFSTAPVETLLPIGESTPGRLYYNVALDISTFAFSYGLLKLLRLRQQHQVSGGRGALLVLTGAILIMILMKQFPYRVFSHRDFERIDYRGGKCYIIGQADDSFLITCPASSPPRNRAVPERDPDLRRTGISENVFRGMTPPQVSP